MTTEALLGLCVFAATRQISIKIPKTQCGGVRQSFGANSGRWLRDFYLQPTICGLSKPNRKLEASSFLSLSPTADRIDRILSVPTSSLADLRRTDRHRVPPKSDYRIGVSSMAPRKRTSSHQHAHASWLWVLTPYDHRNLMSSWFRGPYLRHALMRIRLLYRLCFDRKLDPHRSKGCHSQHLQPLSHDQN